jgi:predicted dehydrogenase
MPNVAVIGLGFMGQTHVRAYQAAAAAGVECRLAAVCDRSGDRLTGKVQATGNLSTTGDAAVLFDPASVKTTTDPRAIFDDPAIDLVSICTHTDTHIDLAMAALKAGKHVLCEKPVALDSTDVRAIAEAAYRYNRLCMPAMCMRFWPGWTWLKDRVSDQSLGTLKSITFQRLGSPPTWSPEFYKNAERSGGALMDLHIHDADFVYYLLGRPEEVTSIGTRSHVTTMYRYDERSGKPTHVVAEGAQDFAPGFGFTMRYASAFADAAATFDLSRPQPLLLHRDGTSAAIELPSLSGYEAQVRHILDAIERGRNNDDLIAPIDDAVAVTKLLEAERESLDRGRPIPVG